MPARFLPDTFALPGSLLHLATLWVQAPLQLCLGPRLAARVKHQALKDHLHLLPALPTHFRETPRLWLLSGIRAARLPSQAPTGVLPPEAPKCTLLQIFPKPPPIFPDSQLAVVSVSISESDPHLLLISSKAQRRPQGADSQLLPPSCTPSSPPDPGTESLSSLAAFCPPLATASALHEPALSLRLHGVPHIRGDSLRNPQWLPRIRQKNQNCGRPAMAVVEERGHTHSQ
ncbi:uncharacterized protein [Macaca fascicularis]|uniref:uncharacterized protein n=1 Tax=Macaca fascicularis TaxID=9541 RepID=UPI003D157B58